MTRKLTNEEIVKRMYELVGDEYSKLDNIYVNSQTKFDIRHNICGHVYKVTWGNLQSGNCCPKCSRKNSPIKLTNEEIVERMYSLVNSEYSKLDDFYANNSTKFPIKHNTCGYEYEVEWNNFKNGKRCPHCFGSKKYTTKEINEIIEKETNGEYKLISEYKNAKSKFLILHKHCGHKYKTTLSIIKSGHRCSKCSGNYRYTDEEMTAMISHMTDYEYTKVGQYSNSIVKFLIRHNTCGHEYEVSWGNFKRGTRCPKCNQSKGEKFISDYLTNQNISFITQVRFDDCRSKYPLPFDFGIMNNKDKIIALIEFDGEQHFKLSRFSTNVTQEQAEENLVLTQLRDQIKNQYCEDNNIPLLRIRYDEDIEEKLTKFLKEQNLIHEHLLKTVSHVTNKCIGVII